jgi:MraZ protein
VFTGREERTLDPKGRLQLPAKWRPDFEPRCYLTSGEQGCIDVMTPREFEEVAKRMKAKVDQGELDVEEFRLVMQTTYEADVDRQGRINIDRELRDYAELELGSRVVVAGTYDRVEIWNAESYEEWTAEARTRRQGPRRPHAGPRHTTATSIESDRPTEHDTLTEHDRPAESDRPAGNGT